jgi:orotidine-5'-phosphate decarboxylase
MITVRDTRHPHAQPILAEYYLYEGVAKKLVDEWTTDATRGNAGMVAGATHPDDIGRIRKIVGSEVALLIPGWGSQGGGAELVKYTGMQNGAPTLINASRSVLYAWAKTEGGEEMPYTAAKEAAVKMAEEIDEAIKEVRKGEE